jgi:chromosomal replication initiation ATPase DnaA
MYLANTLLGRPLEVVAELFQRNRATVMYSIEAVEDLRDDPRIDAEIARIEARLNEVRAPEVKHAA